MRSLAVMVILSTLCVAQVRKPEMPPLSAKLMSAKSVYLIVDTDWVQGHTKAAYKELNKWGRFDVAAEPEKADLIFSISNRGAGSAILSTGGANGTGIAVGPSVFVASNSSGISVPIQLHTYYLHVFDREKGTLLFTASSDERLAKSAETKRLIRALEKRINDQEQAERK
jgi:hypothetical protein